MELLILEQFLKNGKVGIFTVATANGPWIPLMLENTNVNKISWKNWHSQASG